MGRRRLHSYVAHGCSLSIGRRQDQDLLSVMLTWHRTLSCIPHSFQHNNVQIIPCTFSSWLYFRTLRHRWELQPSSSWKDYAWRSCIERTGRGGVRLNYWSRLSTEVTLQIVFVVLPWSMSSVLLLKFVAWIRHHGGLMGQEE